MKRWGDALIAFRKALDLAPNDPALLIKVGKVLEQLYRFEEALDHFQRGHELGARRPDWKVDSADLIQKCAWRIERIEKMDAILEGEAEPTTARELYDLAMLARFMKRHAAAARFWRSAFKVMPRLARSRNLYLAAWDAAMAGTGRGTDAETLDAKARAEWLHLSVVWLDRYVEALAEIHDKYGESRRRQVRQSLLSVRRNPGLGGLREAGHLAVLSQEDQLRCIALWAEVEKLIEECQD
jgi:tetratricopeptide (TPR) repeat protein